MTDLNYLQQALRKGAFQSTTSLQKPLSDAQYSAGFDILVQGPGWITYRDFIIPQLSELLAPFYASRIPISVLEIGPGPKSILGHLPAHLRATVSTYAAFESNGLFATELEKWLCVKSIKERPLPNLKQRPSIHRKPFVLQHSGRDNSGSLSEADQRFNIIILCHSMYGMKPKHQFLKRVLNMLVGLPEAGMVVIFHRGRSLDFNGLVCHKMASFPTGIVSVANEDEEIDRFSRFMAGYVMQDEETDKVVQLEWRNLCRSLAGREEAEPERLIFSSPNIMASFTRHATALQELGRQVPFLPGNETIKNREARLHHPARIMRPREIRHVQQCVRWALEYGLNLTIVGGGHSGHCLWPSVVSVDMSAFNQVHVVMAKGGEEDSAPDSELLVVAEAGCKSGDIVHKAMLEGVTVPLGARPSVGCGLWLQGGIGHLARFHGLACDAIVGAVVVSVDSGRVFCIGHVPSAHQPTAAERPSNESDLLWAIKGAGTNIGIVISVTFKACVASPVLIRNWDVPVSHGIEVREKLSDFNKFAGDLSQDCSADAYLYWETGQMHLGVTLFDTSSVESTCKDSRSKHMLPETVFGPEKSVKVVDSVGLFEADIYVSKMHGGHGNGKTSSFKRCLFLKNIGALSITDCLVAAIENRPTSLCYVHLLQGGGAIREVAADATAFGCRDWDFACVITGVWARSQDGTKFAQAATQWVYRVTRDLLPFSSGVYGADLGPDPRDALLAAQAFGRNRNRLACLKQESDPKNVLAYACPLRKVAMEQTLIILVTGENGAGKDYCASIWASIFIAHNPEGLKVRAVSISDATKSEYAIATGADFNRLLEDRAYKEQHRPALTRFYREQMQDRPGLPEEHFLDIVRDAQEVDVLLITGMRDEAPVAAFSHLVPSRKLLEVRVQTIHEAGRPTGESHRDNDFECHWEAENYNKYAPSLEIHDGRPTFVFYNDHMGSQTAADFCQNSLLPLIEEDFFRLANMVRSVPDFPCQGIEFRHVLNISQQPGGLALCTSLLQKHFTSDWTQIKAIACCETGGLIFASPLATQMGIPLALIREARKLPPPTFSAGMSKSHISSAAFESPYEKLLELERNLIPKGASVVVVDDVLATGKTLCAVLTLLKKAGIGAENVSIIVVAELPIHRGRKALREAGFGRASVQSLLVFDGA
ncbi:hypothetical protein N7462_011429 [Penicillium macrosclerotiorum]|uniref:uncharacterized protein n=1 Tax=Penicillium macrosclerotiorum TaxID=303699 RepID=UPI002549B79F|nr:uncharacterized protein N7462_011429 [Penicillium macrosclerotiorum]KAJ5664616.1 hypothetical protein N7462_011429 [Penicillium macrosclerotiorum]